MKTEVIEVTEHEDGSSTITVLMDSEALRIIVEFAIRKLIEEAIKEDEK